MLKERDKIDGLVRKAVFGSDNEKAHARWMIWEMGQKEGVRPASIHELYMARGRGDVPPFTTPAMNIRILSYDTGRAIFRAAKRLDAGAIICEIARSEIAYTDQRPAEYVAVMTAAALREGFTGPLFIQGDHVQVNAKKYAADPEAELKALRALIEEELHAGFYNIDVDTSTLVDLSKPNLDEQQRTNYERAAELTKFIRDREPEGVHGGVQPDAAAARHLARHFEDLRADRHESRRCRVARRLDCQSTARPRRAESAVARRAHQIRARRRGAARRLDAAGGSVLAVSAVRGGRDPPRHELPDYRHGSSRAAAGPAPGSQRVGQAGSERGVEEGRHRRAVHLQEPQEGDRSLQAAVLGSAGGCARQDRRRPRKDVRVLVRAVAREGHAGSDRSSRQTEARLPCGATGGARVSAGRRGGGRMSERSGGFGAFLLGIVLGAVAGFVFAPTEGGETTRRKVSKGLRNLKELAEDKVDEVRGLLKEAEAEAESEEGEADEDEEAEITTREQLRRRLEAARRRRARAARPPVTPPAAEEE